MFIAETKVYLITIKTMCQTVTCVYQFARGDDCYKNTDQRYSMQFTREISGFNYPPYQAGL